MKRKVLICVVTVLVLFVAVLSSLLCAFSLAFFVFKVFQFDITILTEWTFVKGITYLSEVISISAVLWIVFSILVKRCNEIIEHTVDKLLK